MIKVTDEFVTFMFNVPNRLKKATGYTGCWGKSKNGTYRYEISFNDADHTFTVNGKEFQFKGKRRDYTFVADAVCKTLCEENDFDYDDFRLEYTKRMNAFLQELNNRMAQFAAKH